MACESGTIIACLNTNATTIVTLSVDLRIGVFWGLPKASAEDRLRAVDVATRHGSVSDRALCRWVAMQGTSRRVSLGGNFFVRPLSSGRLGRIGYGVGVELEGASDAE